jgi:uridine kinase
VDDSKTAIAAIQELRRRIPASRSVLVAVTGIDGSGKGYIAARLAEAFRATGVRTAEIGVDGWLNLPERRFSQIQPAQHFYENAIRFEEMFSRLVFPLRDRRSALVEMDFTEEIATEYRRHAYEFSDIDVIVLEGIFLLKRGFQHYYDLSVWIDCGFETALERAISRAQEGLTPEHTARAYREIYFPAQEIHSRVDEPRSAATMTLNNDPRLVAAK